MSDGKVDFFMPLYVGDYLADTSHLAAEEHGAYLLLLMAAWKRGGRLPNDHVQLARIACCPSRRWLRVWGIIARFFRVEGDSLVQGRVVRELENARRSHAGRVRGGVNSAETRRLNRGSAAPGFTAKSPESRRPLQADLGFSSEDPQPQPDPQPDQRGGSGEAPAGALGRADTRGTGIASPASAGAATTTPSRWSGGRWLERFRAAFWDAKGRQYGRGEADSRAAADLGDRLADIDDASRVALEAGAGKVFAAYFAIGGGVADANHPFKWMVERFNEWGGWAAGQAPAAAARRSTGYSTVRSGKDWHAGMDKVSKGRT